MSEAVLTVPNISCQHCERSVIEALSPTEGVEQVSVDIPAKTVRVTYNAERVGIDDLSTILAGRNYPVASVRE
jgi:copper chaperone